MEVKYREEQVITSPYVTQADKMAVSLRHLADRFLKMEPKKQCFTPEEMTEMYDRITEKVQRMQQEIRVPGEKEGRTLAAFL